MADGWFDWLPDLGTLGKIASIGGLGLGAARLGFSIPQMIQQARQADQVRRMQLAISRQMQALAGQRADPSQFYTPMSAAEQTARRRVVEADLATRGIPRDAAYATHLVSEEMASTESQRFQAALRAALQQQQLQGQFLQGAYPQYPQYPQGPQFGFLGDILRYIGSQSPQPPRRGPVTPAPAGAAIPNPTFPEGTGREAGSRFFQDYSQGIDQIGGVGQQAAEYPSDIYGLYGGGL